METIIQEDIPLNCDPEMRIIKEPVESPHYGSLKESRLNRILRYKHITNETRRVLKIIIDNGPVCLCLIAAYAGLSIIRTREIIEYLSSEKINALKIYSSKEIEYHSESIPLYYCP